MNISDTIRIYRTKARMSQAELGKALGVTAQAVSKWECGYSEPDAESMMTLCALFGITADELIGRDGKEPTPVTDQDLVTMLKTLRPDQIQRVRDFVAGLKASLR